MGSAGASPSQPSAPNDTCLFALLDESIQTLGEERLYSADRQLRDELSAKLKGIPPPDSSLSGYRPQPPNARRVLPSERTTPRSPDCLGSRTPPVPGTVVGTHPDFSGPIGRCPVCNAALILLDANGRLLPRHRVSNIVSLPYESLRGVTATASLPYEVRGFLADRCARSTAGHTHRRPGSWHRAASPSRRRGHRCRYLCCRHPASRRMAPDTRSYAPSLPRREVSIRESRRRCEGMDRSMGDGRRISSIHDGLAPLELAKG